MFRKESIHSSRRALNRSDDPQQECLDCNPDFVIPSKCLLPSLSPKCPRQAYGKFHQYHSYCTLASWQFVERRSLRDWWKHWNPFEIWCDATTAVAKTQLNNNVRAESKHKTSRFACQVPIELRLFHDVKSVKVNKFFENWRTWTMKTSCSRLGEM